MLEESESSDDEVILSQSSQRAEGVNNNATIDQETLNKQENSDLEEGECSQESGSIESKKVTANGKGDETVNGTKALIEESVADSMNKFQVYFEKKMGG